LDVWYITTYCQSPFDIEAGCTTGKGNHKTYPTAPDGAILTEDGLFYLLTEDGLYYIKQEEA
jgi:hypothetical protein